jgi:hypothetical protein
MVEIGPQTDRSVKMWKEYFPNAQIIGIDIDKRCLSFREDRLDIVIGDQTDPAFLSSFARSHFGNIDLIVDDGLHTREAVFRSFVYLYPAMSNHGVYAIEDILYGQEWVMPLVARLTAAINFWPPGFSRRRWSILDDLGPSSSWLARNTIGIEFYRYILFVKRGRNPRDNPFLTDHDVFYRNLSARLEEVLRIAARLESLGLEPTPERLTHELGGGYRHAIRDYVNGIRVYGPETTF